MSDRDRRLTRYAYFTMAHTVVLLALLLGVVHHTSATIVLAIISLPYLFTWGHYQADLALNWSITEPERSRWRIAFYALPGAIPLYWYRYVRPRHG